MEYSSPFLFFFSVFFLKFGPEDPSTNVDGEFAALAGPGGARRISEAGNADREAGLG